MTNEEAIDVLDDYDINFKRHTAEAIAEAHEIAIEALEQQQSCENCCNGNQEEKAKLCQKSYIAGMEHNCENEKVIRIKKGTVKVRTGRYVIYDVEWLKTHFNTTEAKIYGQPNEDCISKKAVLDALHRYFADGFDGDKWWNSTHVLDAVNRVPSIAPQPKTGQPKTGHWIMRKRDSSGWKDVIVYVNSEGTVTEPRDEGAYCECSECGEWLVGSDEYACGARYCPNCGAKMQEVQK